MKKLNMKQLNRQDGAVLVVSLIILLVLTLLAVASMSTSNFELTMATNLQNQTLSLANAEVAAGEGEGQVNNVWSPGPITDYINPAAATSAAVGLYLYDSSTKTTAGFVDPIDFDWGDPVDALNGFYTGPSGYNYVVEYMGAYTTAGASVAGGYNSNTNSRSIYRLSGQGTSGGRGAQRLVQTLYLTE